MVHLKRISGFMALAKEIVHDKPGLTAQEIVSRAQQHAAQKGIPLSAAANPVASLTATLHKCHEDFGIERNRGNDGKYRFYPDGQEIREYLPRDLGSQSEPIFPANLGMTENSSIHVSAGSPKKGYLDDYESRKPVPENPLETFSPTVSAPTTTEETPSVNGGYCVELPAHQDSKIKALVALGLYSSEHVAYQDLVSKGLEAVLSKLSI